MMLPPPLNVHHCVKHSALLHSTNTKSWENAEPTSASTWLNWALETVDLSDRHNYGQGFEVSTGIGSP